jgi:serine/threonine-protein phosphatase 2B catalytic subunit
LLRGYTDHAFVGYSEESERVSELKNMGGAGKLQQGVLAAGAENIKDSIGSFDDALVFDRLSSSASNQLLIFSSRKSDIENERLPPELIDPQEHFSAASTPAEEIPQSSSGFVPTHSSHSSLASSLEAAIAKGTAELGSPGAPGSPHAGQTLSGGGFKRGHGRASSLGTTMTSPSTRRRSIESTISLIREAVDGRGENENDAAVDQMVEQFAGGGSSGRKGGSRGSSPARSAI